METGSWRSKEGAGGRGAAAAWSWPRDALCALSTARDPAEAHIAQSETLSQWRKTSRAGGR